VVVVGTGGTLLQLGGAGLNSAAATSAGTALSGAASAAAYPVLAYTVTYGVASHYQRGFEADDAAGRSSAERINQQYQQRMTSGAARVPIVRTAIAVETAGQYSILGVNKASKAIARQIWPDTPLPDEIDGHTQATLLAGFRELHPDARVVPLDGNFLVKIPNANGTVDVVRVDNDEVRTR
jgi:hypothetical protein